MISRMSVEQLKILLQHDWLSRMGSAYLSSNEPLSFFIESDLDVFANELFCQTVLQVLSDYDLVAMGLLPLVEQSSPIIHKALSGCRERWMTMSERFLSDEKYPVSDQLEDMLKYVQRCYVMVREAEVLEDENNNDFHWKTSGLSTGFRGIIDFIRSSEGLGFLAMVEKFSNDEQGLSGI